MIVLGISDGYHDSAIALVTNGQVKYAAQEERYTRTRFDSRFPVEALRVGLQELSISRKDIDVIAYYERADLKVSRQLALLASRKQPLFSALDPLAVDRRIREMTGMTAPVVQVLHHEAHAASAYFCSGFDESAILTLDGVGEWATATHGYGKDRTIRVQEAASFPNSLGLFYSAMTTFLGFDANSDEYKVMGLAAYGRETFSEKLEDVVKFDRGCHGQFTLNDSYFDFMSEDVMYDRKLSQHLNVLPRRCDEPIKEEHIDLARSVQAILEKAVLRELQALYEKYPVDNLCYAGGVALNCVVNQAIRKRSSFKEIFIQPAAGDAGGAVGAALLVDSRNTGSDSRPMTRFTARLGRSIRSPEIEQVVTEAGLPISSFETTEKGICWAAAQLAEGSVLAWFSGREEFGPRALGGRSILADPRSISMRDHINKLIKQREMFRPFAPVATIETAPRLFATNGKEYPHMLETVPVLSDDLKAVTHVDGTARLQTVSQVEDPLLHSLLVEFGKRTGVECLLNTSYNIKGEPIVSSVVDAVASLLRTGVDALVINGQHVLYRQDLEIMKEFLPDIEPSNISRSVYTLF